jgi:hypothetical protein
MANDVTIPEDAPVAAAFAHLNVDDESLTEGITSSFAIVSYRGKNWRLRYKGTTYLIRNPRRPEDKPDEEPSPSNSIDCVVIRKARRKSKSYYAPKAGGASFNPDDIDAHKPPDCASMDSITPDPDVKNKQSDTCALCPHNVWGPQPGGRDGRACRDRMRLAIIIMPAQITPLFGAPLVEPMFLPVPAASLNALSHFGDEMEKNGKHMSTYVTRIAFKDKAWPEFKFSLVRMLKDEEAPVILRLRDDPMSSRIIGEEPGGGRLQQLAPGEMKVISPPVEAAWPAPEVLAVAPVPSAVAEAQEAERKARIAAVRGAAVPTPTAPAATTSQQAQIEALTAQLAALTGVAQTYSTAAPKTPSQARAGDSIDTLDNDEPLAMTAKPSSLAVGGVVQPAPLLDLVAETVNVETDDALNAASGVVVESTPDLDALIDKMMPKP